MCPLMFLYTAFGCAVPAPVVYGYACGALRTGVADYRERPDAPTDRSVCYTIGI